MWQRFPLWFSPCDSKRCPQWGGAIELPLNGAICNMSLWNRLFGSVAEPRDQYRPLWQAIVQTSRDPAYYRDCHVADTTLGRFDMLTIVLALVIIRLEQEADQRDAAALLTELFIADMEGQLRESGMGDPTVGKQVGKMVSALGGRMGALRDAGDDPIAIAPVLARNVTFSSDDGSKAEGTGGTGDQQGTSAINPDALALAQKIAHLRAGLWRNSSDMILKGSFS